MFNIILSLVFITVTGCTTLKSDKCPTSPSVNDLEKSAKNGSVEALNSLGEMYHFGRGVEPDFNKAHDYYLQAAQKGNATAANHLGRLYLNGEGVVANAQEAEKWYKKSAQLDPTDENRCINGVLPDRSFCALLTLARKGNPEAMTAIGEIYLSGISRGQEQILTPNPARAKHWFLKAAEQNNIGAYLMLYHSCKRGAIPCEGPGEIEKWRLKGLENGGETLDFQ